VNCTDLQLLFDIVFEEGVVQGYGRLSREMKINLFFPDEVWKKYADKSKSNFSWFLRGDEKNLAISNYLHTLFEKNPYEVIREMEEKCHAVLWSGSVPHFQEDTLSACIADICRDTVCLMPFKEKAACFPAEKALARLMLTLAFYPPARLSLDKKKQKADLQLIWTQIGSDLTLLDSRILDQMDTASVKEQYRYGCMLYSEKRHEEAFEQFSRAIDKILKSGRRQSDEYDDGGREPGIRGQAASVEEAALFCQAGRMLLSGDGCQSSNPSLAHEYIRYACRSDYPEAHYERARLLREGLGCARNEEKAFDHLRIAAQLDYIPAIRDLGSLYYSGSSVCASDMEQALVWLRRGIELNIDGHGEDRAFCQYMIGVIMEALGNREQAMICYEQAVSMGSAEAAEKQWKLESGTIQNILGMVRETHSEDKSRRFFFNGMSGGNRILCDTLPPHAKETILMPDSIREMAQMLNDLFMQELSCAYIRQESEAPHLVFSFLSENQQSNLEYTMAALQMLTEMAQQLGEPACWRLVDHTSIYIQGKHEFCSMILDAALAQMGKLYFRVRLIDPDKEAAEYLFNKKPLFAPLLREKEARHIGLVILGATECSMHIIREAVSMYMGGYPLQITVLGCDTDILEGRLKEECPGLYDKNRPADYAIPLFYSCNLEAGGLNALLSAAKQSKSEAEQEDNDVLKAAAQRIRQGNYFVVATDDDAFNFSYAVRLRAMLLKMTPSYTNRPPVCVLMRQQNAASSIARKLPVLGEGDNSWWAQYDLFYFGTGMQLYAWQSLSEDRLEKQALSAHMMYWNCTEDDTQLYRACLNKYYSRQYNRDSSRMLALYLPYRLFGAGFALDHESLYADPTQMVSLGRAYIAWLEENRDHMEAAVRGEHERWCAYLLAHGWEQASAMETAAYVQLGNPSHQLHIARKHPFICTWGELRRGGIQNTIHEIMQRRFPGSRLVDPRDGDAITVRATLMLLEAHV